MLNRSASLAMSTSILKALPSKLDIKRHSPCILYLLNVEVDITVTICAMSNQIFFSKSCDITQVKPVLSRERSVLLKDITQYPGDPANSSHPIYHWYWRSTHYVGYKSLFLPGIQRNFFI